MSEINYKLIYDLKKTGMTVLSKSNRRADARNKAEAEADREHEKLERWLLEQLPPDTKIDITCEYCDVAGNHVFTWKGDAPANVGKRVCCFCGIDDFDF